ncbi:hypothetical protein DFH28DRAFT_1132234 [Melampsora americana]|nr:hypothetical protein DFH28DRAFT_1132234 [Melampsora americana]
MTRSRDYTANPRSPPKRKRRTTRKNILPIRETNDNDTSYFFPNLSLLPPLPHSPTIPPQTLSKLSVTSPPSHHSHTSESPITELTKPEFLVLTVPFSFTFPNPSTLPPLPPSPLSLPDLNTLPPSPASPNILPVIPLESTSPSDTVSFPVPFATPDPWLSPHSVSELIPAVSRLNLETTSTYVPLRSTTTFLSIAYTPFTSQPTVFNPTPFIPKKMSTTVSPSNAAAKALAMNMIDRANKHLANEIKFDHLEKDGSDFIKWKKNTARAMKALLNVTNYWDTPQPLSSAIDIECNILANSVINNTIHDDLKDVTDDTDSAYAAMQAL